MDPACHGIRLLREGHLEAAMPLLLQRAKDAPQDWTSMEFAAAGFGMAARRMIALPPPHSSAVSAQERKALQGAVHYFSRAARIKSAQGEAVSPCATYAEPPGQALRAWGDALAWLGQPDAAAAVFASPVARHLWPDPFCRPFHQWAVRAGWHSIMGQSTYVFDAPLTKSLFGHVQQPVVQRLLPRLRDALILHPPRDGDAWSPESAGLHMGRTWYALVLWANGAEGSACATAEGFSAWTHVCAELRALLMTVPGMNTARGQIKLSRMSPGTSVRAHAGPTNERLRMHCSVDVPRVASSEAMEQTRMQIRVGDVWRSWAPAELDGIDDTDGSCFVFREECEHEVIVAHTVERARTVLIVDFANPFLNGLHLYRNATSTAPTTDGACSAVAAGGAEGGGACDEDEDLVAAEYRAAIASIGAASRESAASTEWVEGK